MKKNLYFAILLLAVSTTAYKAQTQRGVGINTDSPHATLDVKASTSAADNAVPDAILVPRMTLAQLVLKDNTSGTYGVNQNGALIYITDDAVGSGARRAKINGHGFYYFDNIVPEWKPFVGSSTPPVTTVNVVTPPANSSYTAGITDDIILLNNSLPGTTITLPTSGIAIGKKLYISNAGGNSVDIIPAPRETANTAIQANQAAEMIYTGGTTWLYLAGY